MLKTYQKIGVAFLVFVASGFFGWVYETIFYFFNDGMAGLRWQGGNFLPWINIYAIGAFAIIMTTYKLRKRPWVVFLLSMLVSGIVEYVGGWLVYHLFDGARYWDYNTEILNFGSIDGFVCLRSVLFFGLSALFLIYVLLPFFVNLSKTMSKRAFLILATSLFCLVLVDEVYNMFASRIEGLPDAREIYKF